MIITMSDKFLIKGGVSLTGETEVRGSKNAATKMMVASLLTEEPCILENIPRSEDTEITKELCEKIGSRVTLDNHTCRIESPEIKNSLVPELSRRNRIPVLALGPLLHRRGVAEIPVPGGCPIGHRPINFHVEALSKMGVVIERRENSYYATTRGLHGADMVLPYPSVGATENVILTAVTAEGKTRIRNAAIEPEILNLLDMLMAMGAKISLDLENRKIEIEGVKRLTGVKIKVIPDRNEIVSLASAALATRGKVKIKNIGSEINFAHLPSSAYLKNFLEKVREVGGVCENKDGGLEFIGQKEYRATIVETSPHPGFMTDWQQPFCILLTQAHGKSIIHETVYEDRLGYTKDLKRMGAKIEISAECPEDAPCRYRGKSFNHTAFIEGPTRMRGKTITMTDIRAGMAHIIAALVAEGQSEISGIDHVDRGYEKIEERLKELGADIERKTKSEKQQLKT